MAYDNYLTQVTVTLDATIWLFFLLSSLLEAQQAQHL